MLMKVGRNEWWMLIMGVLRWVMKLFVRICM